MSAATDDLRFLPAHAADLIDRVGWTQGTERDDAGRVCLTGALRYCNPQPGDWLLAREVFRAKGRAEGWNDASERTCNEVVELLRSTEITDAELAQTFGPSWETVVQLVHTTATITPEQVLDLDAAWGAAWDAATRDLIGQHGYTQAHYDTLTRPWREVVGRLHPDDADLRVVRKKATA